MADGDARVYIELRALLDNFIGKDLPKASAALRKEFSGVTAKIGTDTSAKEAAGTDKKTAAVNKHTNALRANKQAELERWRAANPGGVIPGNVIGFGETAMVKGLPQGPISMGPMIVSNIASAIPKALAQSAKAFQLAHPMYLAQGARQLMGMGPLQFPQQTMHMAPPWQLAQGAKNLMGMGPLFPPANAGNSIASLVSGWVNKTMSGPQTGIFKLTAGLAALRVGLGLASYALRLIVWPAEKLAKIFLEASDSARRLYASSLMSGGLPIKFTQYRQSLANVIGVGENDVLQFGSAIRTMSADLKYSNKVIADTNPTLTAMGWEWKILGQDMKALKAEIAYSVAPLIHILFNTMHAGLVDLIFMAKLFANQPMIKAFAWAMSKMGQGAPEAPAPVASARRYPTSAFERAGLVLSAYGAGGDAAKETAKNTAKTNSILAGGITIRNLPGNGYNKIFGASTP